MTNLAISIWQEALKLGPKFPMRHVSRLLKRDQHVANIEGIGPIRMRPGSPDADTICDVFLHKEYDLSVFKQFGRLYEAYNQIVDSGLILLIIDAGANIGAASLWFAKQFPKAHVIAVEPEPSNFKMCCLNSQAFKNIKPVEVAIGSKAGRVKLSDTPISRANAFVTTRLDEDPSANTAVCDIPSLVASNSHYRLLIAKIDIEGFEDDLFSANLDWINDVMVIIIEPHDWLYPNSGKSLNFQRALADRPFEVLILGQNLVYFQLPEMSV